MEELVSCIIPSYKRADTLKRAIDSVLAQTYKNIEILVVDDNIPGDEYSIALREIVNSYDKNCRVKLITQPKHINGAEARNAGVHAAKGEYIAFLDDDDEWLPDKTERQMAILLSDPELGGVAGGATLWRNDREISSLRGEKIEEKDLLFKVLIRDVGLGTPTFLCRKTAYSDIGGFDTSLNRSQDLQLFAHFLAKYRIYPISEFKTVKVHVESAINRPNSKSIAKNKEDYFNSINDVLMTFPLMKRNRIKSAHYYEVALVALRENSIIFALKYILKGLMAPMSLLDLYRRYRRRKN